MTKSNSDSPRSQLANNLNLKDLYNNIQKDLDEVEEKLKLLSSTSNKLISEISTYLFHKSGKRIRPALLILCSKLLNYKGQEHIFMAALVEIIHTASLIHDDIIDKAKKRRGEKTVHAKWGPNITVLLGDYLYIKSIGLSLQSEYTQIIQILSDVSAKMIEGELTEYYMSGDLEISENDYLDIIDKKTASLFSATCQIGGILGNASPKEEKILMEYGTNLGMSFQIIDDLLDFGGDEKILGKPLLSDLNERRITLPLIYTLNNNDKANQANPKCISNLLQKKKIGKMEKEQILSIVKSNGALEYAFKKAEEFSRSSIETITQFPKSGYRDTLILLAEFVIKRNK